MVTQASTTQTGTPSSAQSKHDPLAAIRPDMNQLNEVIRQTLHSEVPLVNQISEYLISAGGKRLRPAIHLLLTRALQNFVVIHGCSSVFLFALPPS